jgi:hypothetical protein
VSNRDGRGQKPHLNIRDRQRALAEDECEPCRESALDLRTSFPPPPDDIYDIPIISEQFCVSSRVVTIPGVCLPGLDIPNGLLIPSLRRGCGRSGEGNKETEKSDCEMPYVH